METRLIIPNDNFKEYNPSLKGFVEGRMKVVTDLTPIETGNDVFVINNYGFGGSNAHMLLRRLDKIKSVGDLHEDLPRLVCFSGRSESSVSNLLDELDRKQLDPEYVGLLHHLFKNNVPGHLCRGFAIVSKNTSTIRSTNTLSQQTSGLYIFFGSFFNNFAAVGKYLLQFPVFEDIIEKIDNCNSNRNEIRNVCEKATTNLGEAVLQLGIVELLKLLEIQPSIIYEDHWGKIIAMYYQGKLGLAETLSKLEVLDKQCTTNGIGHNPQIHKLYPKIEFPVSRGTPMLSPILKWNHKKKWNTFSFHEFEKVHSTPERIWPLSTEIYRDQKYLEDHVADGRSLVPATDYLNLVWKVFALQHCINQERLPVVFENCKFLKAQPIGGNIHLSLDISIHIHSGKFEIFETESSSLVMTGKIFIPVDIEKYKTDLPLPPINEERGAAELLESNEIYRELNLRRYNYRNTFRGRVKCNVEGTYGLVKWENNWTTFIDSVLQLKIFEIDARTLFVPVSFNRVIIDPIAHMEFIKGTKKFLCPVDSYKDCQMVKCGGIVISGIASTFILRKLPPTPLLEKYVFVQNEFETNLAESIRIIVQIILENNLDNYFDALEVVDEYSSPKSEFVVSLVSKILSDIIAVNSRLSICSKTNIEPPDGVNVQTSLQTSGDVFLVVATKVMQRPKALEKFVTAIKPGEYILSREEADYVPRNADVLVVHRTGQECLVLFQNCKQEEPTKYIQITWKNYDWMKPLKEALKQGENIVVYSQNDDSEGITGLIFRNFIMDKDVQFDPELAFYKQQLRKNLAVNILKNGKWGTYRHLPLDDVEEVESQHTFVTLGLKGQLNTLKWIEGPLTRQTKVKDGDILIYVSNPIYLSV
ncbi:hypothetical protein Zmor_015541 [Zophobas morio]|uniref:PKS/mFAS DH domain-containing protein n=1 Tax=Zophobas morio TaxID=2755281 RepID=A0AA38MHA3_9CUCU|nr:hypothetical protein Zmor_015541 [Zophobas morio]